MITDKIETIKKEFTTHDEGLEPFQHKHAIISDQGNFKSFFF